MRALSRLIVSLAIFSCLPFTTAEARRVALVIGNGAYRHTDQLPNPTNDAAAVGRSLERIKFDKVIVRNNLTAEAMRRALLDFEADATGAEIALVYFAGHGIEVDGQNYLIPTDARLARAAAVDVEAIPLSTVTGMLSGVQTLRLVILDACRNNPFKVSMASDTSGGRKRSIGRGLKGVEPGDNELVAFAAAGGTEADDGADRHSPFTTALLKHIETPNLEVRFLFAEIRDEVVALTGRQQTPHVYGTLGRKQIFLNPMSLQAAAPTPAEENARLRMENDRLRREREVAMVAPTTPMPQTAARAPQLAVPPPSPGTVIRDCPNCPDLVVLPTGTFSMGGGPREHDGLPASQADAKAAWQHFEGPARNVVVTQTLAVGKHEVTFAEWDACVADGVCSNKPDSSWGRDRQPVVSVSWEDAKQFTGWLSARSGKTYRLLTEAEWEFAARAGTATRYSVGDAITTKQAQFAADRPTEVGKFPPNAWGLHDMHGNAFEWVEDCWNDSYANAPADGSARPTGDCKRRVVRGGSWQQDGHFLRSAFRVGFTAGLRNDSVGFRVVRVVTP